jgi:hypothetical protein
MLISSSRIPPPLSATVAVIALLCGVIMVFVLHWHAAEASRELRPILQRAELAFRVGIVIGDVRTAVRSGYTQVR